MSEIITEQPALQQLCAKLVGASRVGLDTEFLRERTYFAQLCLLQVSVGETVCCIDPLVRLSLEALKPVLTEPAVEKVLHSARQDLEVLWPLAGAMHGIFDTQIAAALLGLPAQVGYAELVRLELGVVLPKSQTRTDWSRRPLSADQIAYALDDVRYLLPLRDRLAERLEAQGRWSWFTEEMRTLEAAAHFDVDPGQAWQRLRGLDGLDPGRRALAQALAAWREQRAIEANRPRGWIVPDASLRDMVLRVPRTAEALARTAELPEGTSTRSGPALLSLIETLALPAVLPPLPGHRRPDPAVTEAVRRLGEITRERAAALGVVPEVLATRRDMERMVQGARDVAPLTGWREQEVGRHLLAALA